MLAYRSDARIRCTTHSCTVAFGHTTPIASGRPVNPSQHTMHTSCTPRDFSSDSTDSQNFADSPVDGPIHMPSTCFAPSQSMPMARYTGRFATTPSRIFTISASMNTTGYTASNGRACHACSSSSTASVTLEIRSGDTSTWYISRRCAWISRVVNPRAYSARSGR